MKRKEATTTRNDATIVYSDSKDTDVIYFNLSCPLEWSKFSRIHQGQYGKAWKKSAARRGALESSHQAIAIVAAASTQSSSNINKPQIFPAQTRLFLIGDSMMRQVFLCLGCLLDAADLVQEFQVDWRTLVDWPCHGTPACIPRGVHSGFRVGSLHLVDDTEIHLIMRDGGHGDGAMRNQPYFLTRLWRG